MTNGIFNYFAELWAWTRANDISNWITVAFTAIVWPIALFLWHRRKTNSVPGLEVHFVAGGIKIGEKDFPAVDIQFTNHTGAVVYISGARIRSCTKKFPVPVEAARDIAQGSNHLKFLGSGGHFSLREVTLQTNETRKTCLPTTSALEDDFYSYSPIFIRRLFRFQKYFVLEYTVMVGTERYCVATVY
jgi:hypothetical protein